MQINFFQINLLKKWRHQKWRHGKWRHSMLIGYDFSLEIYCLDFNFYHSFVVEAKESIFLLLV